MNEASDLILEIARVGKEHPFAPPLFHEVDVFRALLNKSGGVFHERLDERDGNCTYRELAVRFLLLLAVLDQGPDIEGVRQLAVHTTNALYQRGVDFLHRPEQFFVALDIAIDEILENHETVRSVRAEIWARENNSNPSKYNLFLDNTRQVLNYAVFRWGVPLSLILVLERDAEKERKSGAGSVLSDYLESWSSAEVMSWRLKDHERYGLGKAIGDKACHLFAKRIVSSFSLCRRKDAPWGPFSFEVPYDSNAGRVLWRTGYLLRWATEADYERAEVLQRGKGKGGTTYIRVTNIRGMKTAKALSKQI